MAGRPLKIVTRSSDEEMSKLGLAVRRALGARGGDLARANNDESVRILTEGDFDIAVLTPLIWPIGMASLIFHSGSQRNILHLDSPAVDAALESGNWVHVLDALDRDPALVFVCTRDRIAIIDSRVKNPRLGPWGLFETLPEWEVGE